MNIPILMQLVTIIGSVRREIFIACDSVWSSTVSPHPLFR